MNYNRLPCHMRSSMKNYIEHRILPGQFLCAVLENNLCRAVGHADVINITKLKDFVEFLYNDAPSECWGSRERVRSWIERNATGAGQSLE
jgi:hypothetical protein